MQLQELRNAALEIYLDLQQAGHEPEVSSTGRGANHAMWLALQIGKKIDDVNKANRYLGNIQTILVYERIWTQEHMMDRAYYWSRGQFRNIAGNTASRPRRQTTTL